jgi:hypothetical protein
VRIADAVDAHSLIFARDLTVAGAQNDGFDPRAISGKHRRLVLDAAADEVLDDLAVVVGS